MKRFLSTYSVFILMAGVLITSVVTLINRAINAKATFMFNSNIKYVILGNSHPECAYNDTLLNRFLNLSKSAESYYFTFFKIQKIIAQNKQIDTFFIECSNIQFTEQMDESIWGRKSSTRYILYAPFIPIQHHKVLIKNNVLGLLNNISVGARTNATKLISNDLTYQDQIGGYLFLERDKTDSLLQHIPTQSENNSHQLSLTNIYYLEQLITYCQKQHKKVFLIRSPMHRMSTDFKNERQFLSILKTRFGEIEFLDFSKFPLENDEFGDLEHLNHKGAKKYSI
jgi:hypothetical protein